MNEAEEESMHFNYDFSECICIQQLQDGDFFREGHELLECFHRAMRPDLTFVWRWTSGASGNA